MPKKTKAAEEKELEEENAPLAFEDDPDVLDDAAREEHRSVTFDISSYGADYSVDMLVSRMRSGAFYVPDFQRAYVWNQRQGSRFIESLLMGLPVPGIFMFKDPSSSKHLIIDGQQRLRTLQFFYDGTFRERRFRLLDVADEWNDRTYQELDEDDRQRLDDSIIHTTIFKQDHPKADKSSVYEVFERINTGGVKLSAQEIRSCVSPGRFISLLRDLNENEAWRHIYGKKSDRLKDQELILRFLAMALKSVEYKRPMRRFLDSFLDANQNLNKPKEVEFRGLFESVIEIVDKTIGPSAFRPEKQLNTAVFDAVMVGLSRRLKSEKKPNLSELRKVYDVLLKGDEFRAAYLRATADEEQVKSRIKLATDAFASI
jgi:hypothetical protein